MKNVLVTGGAGFIGANLSLKLINQGFNVTVLDILSRQIHGDNPSKTSATFKMINQSGINFIKGSVTKRSDWEKALKNQDAVIHLAAETGTGQSMYEIEKYVEVNIGGTSLMLDVLTNTTNKVKKIIVASSRAIYGEGKYACASHGNVYPLGRTDDHMKRGHFDCTCPYCGHPVNLLATDEESEIHPSSIYGITKMAQEKMVLTVGKSIGIPSVAFRYQNVYGPGQSLSNPYTGILSIFSTQIKNSNNINIFEDGTESRDFVYIDDVVDATILGLISDRADYEALNVGADKPIDVLTVAKLLRTNYRSEIDIRISGNYRSGDIRHNYADLTKIKKLLSFSPAFSFEKGLEIFCEWVESQEVKEDHYQVSINEMKMKGLFK